MPPTIFMGGMFTIPSHGWFIYGIVLSFNHIITHNNPAIHGIVLTTIHPHDTGAHLLEPEICQGQFQLLRHRLHRGRCRLARSEEVRSSELGAAESGVWAGNLWWLMVVNDG